MGIYTDFAHFSGFQLEKLLNLRGGGGKKESQEGALQRDEWKISTGFYSI